MNLPDHLMAKFERPGAPCLRSLARGCARMAWPFHAIKGPVGGTGWHPCSRRANSLDIRRTGSLVRGKARVDSWAESHRLPVQACDRRRGRRRGLAVLCVQKGSEKEETKVRL